MTARFLTSWLAICVSPLASAMPATTQATVTSRPSGETRPISAPLTVAILDFDTDAPGNPNLGKQISEALTAELTGQEGITLVDRSSLTRALQENELSLTGLVNAEKANKIGKIVGAKILITGKVFPLDKQLFFTAKLIGTETSLVEGVLVKGGRDGNLGEMLLQLSEKVSRRLHEQGLKLIAQDEELEGSLPALKKALAGRILPKVLVRIQETHIGPDAVPELADAAQTEILSILKDVGFSVITGTDKEAADASVRYIIEGKAFSEFAARIETLVNCSARLEVSVLDRKSGEVFYSDRVTTRAIDLAENTAGKTALQKAGRAVGLHILQQFKQSLPQSQPAAP